MRTALRWMGLLAISSAGCELATELDEEGHEARRRCGIVDLGILPGHVGSAATALNDRGDVVGISWSRYASTPIPYQWSQQTGLVALPVRPGERQFGKPEDINDVGEVVGTLFGMGNDEAVRWSDGEIAAIECAGGEGNALSINRRGQFSGACSGLSAPTRAYLWSDGPPRELRPLPGETRSVAYAVNDRGIAVGVSYTTGGDQQATLWTRRGTPTSLGAPEDGATSTAHDVNQRGEVAVYSASTDRSYLFADGEYVDLGTVEGTQTTYAVAINRRGRIVGLSGYGTGEVRRAFRWRDGEIVALDELLPPDSGWTLTSANDINDRGQIVGGGLLDGAPRAFLLTPCD